jgi:PKD repeat protein
VSSLFKAVGGGRARVGLLIVVLSVLAAWAAAPAAWADQTITSPGPLTSIGLGSDLHCSVSYTGDTYGEFFYNTACGTFLDVGGPVGSGGTVYGPNTLPAGGAVNSTPFTPAAFQAPVSGDGSAANPFTASAQGWAGNTGLSLTQTDSYVTGADLYRSTVTISNSAGSAQTVVLYHAADCYLGDDDRGYGYYDNASGGVFCTKNANNSPAGRVEGFIPVEGGSAYLETGYNANWATVGTGRPLPDTCDCSTFQDNGMSISWTVTVPAGGAVTRSWATDFSPVGNLRVSSYVALGDSVAAGEGIAYDWTWNGSTWDEGNPNPSWDTSAVDPTSGQSSPNCHQTTEGYPHVLAGLLSANLLDLGCTSASTSNGILGSEPGKSGPQLGGGLGAANLAYDAASPDVVSLTVGADDVDFSHKVSACYRSVWLLNFHACGTEDDWPTFLSELGDFQVGLNSVLQQIEERGQQDGKIPLVAITEYYSPFPNSYPTNSSCIDIGPDRRGGITLTDSEMQYLEQGLLDLNGTIDDVASQYPNVVIVPAPVGFRDHRWCSADPWVYGPSLRQVNLPDNLSNPAPFHPTPEGQQAIAQNIAYYLADERHVEAGPDVPLNFGDISVLFSNVQQAGTAFFTALGSTTAGAAARSAPEGSARVMPATAARTLTTVAAGSGGAGLPPTSMFSPVQIYSAGTSAQYTNGLTVTLPALGATALYEVVNGAWQLIPTTSDGTNLTATLGALGTLALGNPAPAVSAAFTTSGDGGQAPDNVTFDASGSTVAWGSIVSYQWDFGDGATGGGARLAHAYTAAGTYTVTLTATSGAGASDVATHTVTVTDAPPVPVVTFPATATVGAPVSGFDASGSYTAVGPVADVYWDFGDGSAVVDGATGKHTFTAPGSYTVTATVMDDEGATATQSAVITVLAPGSGANGNPPPGANRPPSGANPPGTTSAGPSLHARLTVGRRITVKHGRLAVSLACANPGLVCSGRLTLTVRVGRRTVTVASGRFAVKPGGRLTLRLALRRAAAALLGRAYAVAAQKAQGSDVTVTLRPRDGKASHGPG